MMLGQKRQLLLQNGHFFHLVGQQVFQHGDSIVSQLLHLGRSSDFNLLGMSQA
jgi:hypothetical protein